MTQMKALVRTKDGVAVADVEPPRPAEGEALIRPTRLAVSPGDLAVARGDLPFEGVMGTRFVGVVESVAGDRGADLVGARVVSEVSVVPTDAELARRGLPMHAPERTVPGLHGRDGVFAERFCLPVRNLVRVPDDVSDDAAVFTLPVAEAVHASRVVRLEGKSYVTVLGETLPALLSAQVMARLNNTVRLLGRDPARLALCDKWGVRHRPVDEVGRWQDQDVVIECTGTAEMIDLALGLVRPRGKIVLKTEPAPLPGLAIERAGGVDLTPAILHEVELIGARDGRASEAVEALASGTLELAGLISARVKFDQIERALEIAAAPETVCVLIDV